MTAIAFTPALVTRNTSFAFIWSAEAKKSHAKEVIELGRIDINTATEKELKMIPGVGPVMASRIIAARPFRSADDLKKVNGIGDKKYAKIRPYFQ
jgi:competence ComEA-like helix-hairpin-helix protein